MGRFLANTRGAVLPSVIVPAALLQAVWQCEQEVCENTFWYKRTGTWDQAALQAICDTYIAWAAASAGIFTDACGLLKCIATDMTSLSGQEVTVVPATGVSGTNTSGRLPNNVTFALKRETGLRGRKNRGRIYLIGLPLENLGTDRQTVTGAHAANLVSLYNGLLSGQLSSNSATEVIAHRSTSTVTPVTQYAVADDFLDSQRRRLPGHNRHH